MNVEEAVDFGLQPGLVERLSRRKHLELTSAQEAAIRAGLCLGESLLIAAPTSSGKTTIAEIAAVQGAMNGSRTVYLVSHRSLAEEKYRLFRNQYDGHEKWFSVSIATGDHAEGEWDDGVLVATYEKFLAMVCSSQSFDMRGIVIVADEIQIIGEKNRGPEIELLMTLIKRGRPAQLVGLSATISNPDEVAGWLNCKPVKVFDRDVPLRQEVWTSRGVTYSYAGKSDVFEGEVGARSTDTLSVVDRLLGDGNKPILVFTMTKSRATSLATDLSRTRKVHLSGTEYADQLDLFSEPTTLVNALSETSQKRIGFHTADLNMSEREIVERGVSEERFDVVFATPTLAAGVNFPFRAVVFDSFQRDWEKDNPWLSLAEYNNMAGRAGRLGMHQEGLSVLIAPTMALYPRAISYISTPIDPLVSNFLGCSLRKVVLTMLASKVVSSESDVIDFFRETFWYSAATDRNARISESLPVKISAAVKKLIDYGFVISLEGRLSATRLGIAVAGTGMRPQSAFQLLTSVRENQRRFMGDLDVLIVPLVHAIFACDEFVDGGPRFLPFSRRNSPEQAAEQYVRRFSLFLGRDSVHSYDKIVNATYGISLWVEGAEERELKRELPSISYGQMQYLGGEAARVLSGLIEVIKVPESLVEISIASRLFELVDRFKYGLPSGALDAFKVAAHASVPGFGRHRAMALLKVGLSEPNEIIKADRGRLVKVLGRADRVDAFLEALIGYFDDSVAVWKPKHLSKAALAGIDSDLIRASYEASGAAYEVPVEEMLRSISEWKIHRLDDGRSQGRPDFAIESNGRVLLLECKTKMNDNATIDKSEAFAVWIKGADVEHDHCITLGKPGFDEFSKSRACAAKNITLLQHSSFVEAFLRYRSGVISAEEMFIWLMIPGVARLELLGGK